MNLRYTCLVWATRKRVDKRCVRGKQGHRGTWDRFGILMCVSCVNYLELHWHWGLGLKVKQQKLQSQWNNSGAWWCKELLSELGRENEKFHLAPLFDGVGSRKQRLEDKVIFIFGFIKALDQMGEVQNNLMMESNDVPPWLLPTRGLLAPAQSSSSENLCSSHHQKDNTWANKVVLGHGYALSC